MKIVSLMILDLKLFQWSHRMMQKSLRLIIYI